MCDVGSLSNAKSKEYFITHPHKLGVGVCVIQMHVFMLSEDFSN